MDSDALCVESSITDSDALGVESSIMDDDALWRPGVNSSYELFSSCKCICIMQCEYHFTVSLDMDGNNIFSCGNFFFYLKKITL